MAIQESDIDVGGMTGDGEPGKHVFVWGEMWPLKRSIAVSEIGRGGIGVAGPAVRPDCVGEDGDLTSPAGEPVDLSTPCI